MGHEDRSPKKRYTRHDGPEEDVAVRRLEEDSGVGVRQTEAGTVDVRKDIRTEREEVRTGWTEDDQRTKVGR